MASELDRRFRSALDRIRNRYGAFVAAEWAKLPHYNEEDIAVLVAAIEPVANATAATTSQLTSGYLAIRNRTTVAPTGLPPIDLAESVRPAFMTVWGALADGQPWQDAVAAGSERALSTGRFYVTTVSRQTLDVVDQASPEITAWIREPEANACPWCEDVSQVVFDTAAAADIGHDNCHCDIVPA
jgi:hypothetical protein